MKKKSYLLKRLWEKDGFGKRPRACRRKHGRIIANPGLVIKVLGQKKMSMFLVFFLLVALSMLNISSYLWAHEQRQCRLQTNTSSDFPVRMGTRLSFMPPQVRKRQLVYVLTTWRSGSSFFGELFNQNPGVFFLYEPIWHVWKKLYPSDAVSLQGAARDMLRALYRCDFSIFQLYSTADRNMTSMDILEANSNKVICSYPLCSFYRKEVVEMVNVTLCNKCPPRSLHALETECLKYDTVVIKGVRILDVNVLAPLMEDPSFDLRLIHFVRDPRAVANSRIKTKKGLLSDSHQLVGQVKYRAQRASIADGHHKSSRKDLSEIYALAAMRVICQNTYQTLRLALNPPSWLKGKYLLVRFEDMVGNPIQTLRQLYRFANLSSSQDMEAFVLNVTHGKRPVSRNSGVSERNASRVISGWRNALSYAHIRQVEEYCHHAMSILGYLRVRSMSEVKNMGRTLVTSPKV